MFLHPHLLWGLAALAGPLILWLLFRRPRETVRWGATRLLERARSRTARRRHLQGWVLLVLRVAALAALVAAAAVPLIPHRFPGWLGAEELPVVLVLDSSTSMRTREREGARFELVRSEVDRILESLTPGTPVSLLSATTPLRWLERDQTDHEVVRRRLEAWEPGFGSDDWTAVARALGDIPSPVTILGWTDPASAVAVADLEGQWRVMGESMPNVAVTTLEVLPGDSREESRVEARLRSHGPSTQRTVRLWVDDREHTADRIELPADSERALSWSLPRPRTRSAVVRVELDPDALPADDHQAVILPATGKLQVRLILPDEFPVHLETAMQTLAELGRGDGLDVERHRVSDRPPRAASEREVWILAGLTELDAAWEAALRDARSAGVGQVWFLETELGAPLGRLLTELTGVRIEALALDPEHPITAEVVAPDSRWIRGWLRDEPRAITHRIWSGWSLVGDSRAEVLVRTARGQALWMVGDRWFVSGSSVRPEDSDLAIGRGGDAPLLPLLLEVLEALGPESIPMTVSRCGQPLPGGADAWTDLTGAMIPDPPSDRRPGLYRQVSDLRRTCQLRIDRAESATQVERAPEQELSDREDLPRAALSTTCLWLAAGLLMAELWLASALPRAARSR